jgi:hypothetical protein
MSEQQQPPHCLRIVYFIPADRQPEPDFQNRLERVMKQIQQFYRQGMAENGYSALSFPLERHPDGTLNIHIVRAQQPMQAYGRDSHDQVRQEVKEALALNRIHIDQETIIIFQLLLAWQNGVATEVGPFVGYGTPHYGTAWVYDDALLDPLQLTSCAPGGYYGQPCSVGQFNTHYLGGVAHELGHALGLPHDCEGDQEQAQRGYSLMGRGNHTYGQELRGQGKGTFLSAASALPLSVHPLFTGQPKPEQAFACQLNAFEMQQHSGRLTITGQLHPHLCAPAQIFGVVAHSDPKAIADDYSAQGWVAVVDAQGNFQLQTGILSTGDYELRLTVYDAQGQSQMFCLDCQIQTPKNLPENLSEHLPAHL